MILAGVQEYYRPAISDETRNALVEEIARSMCQGDGVDPDALAAFHEPEKVLDGYVIQGKSFPAWRLYGSRASIAVDRLTQRRTSTSQFDP